MDWSVENREQILSIPSVNNKIEQNPMKLSTNKFKRPLSDTNTPKSPNSLTASSNKML